MASNVAVSSDAHHRRHRPPARLMALHARDARYGGAGTPAIRARRRLLLPSDGSAELRGRDHQGPVRQALHRGVLRRVVLARASDLLELGLRWLTAGPSSLLHRDWDPDVHRRGHRLSILHRREEAP